MTPESDDPKPVGRSGAWRSLVATGVSTLSSAIAHAPEYAAYGLLTFAALGPAFGPTAMALALFGAVVACVVATALGGGRLVTGARASLALLTAGLVATLSRSLPPQDPASIPVVLGLVALGLVGAGALQTGFGLLKLGNIVKYTPHSVRVGVASGVGLLLVLTALPVALGKGFATGLRAAIEAPLAGAVLVGLCALVVSAVAARRQSRLPPDLLGLGAAVALHHALALGMPAEALGPSIGTPVLPTHWLVIFDPRVLEALGSIDIALVVPVASYALAVAALCSLDTLFAVSVVDGRLRRVRDANRELIGQGIAGVVTGLAAAQPVSPSILRSLTVVVPNPGRRHIVLVYASALLGLLLLAPQLVGQVPASALGGILLLQGAQMIAPTFWRAPLELWRYRRRDRTRAGLEPPRHHLRSADWAVELAVSLGAVLLGLGPAVVIGASCAVLLFVRASMRDVVRLEWSGETRRSLKARPSSVSTTLAREGRRIAVLELQGTLFFGTADGLRVRLSQLESTVDTAILDLHQVTDIDGTAARILLETAEHWSRIGRHLVLTEWPAGDIRRHMFETAGSLAVPGVMHFAEHTDLALEQAEDRLLGDLRTDGGLSPVLDLADTMLGRGLEAAELAILAAELELLHFARGQVLFRAGDPGDGLYISLQGDIGLRLPGSGRRLASFAPGVVIGEMATLARTTRSAEAVAESDVTAMKLSADAFDRLMAERPTLAAKLLKNVSLHLADRVRTLTGDLSRWVTRAAAGRVVSPAVDDKTLQPDPGRDG